MAIISDINIGNGLLNNLGRRCTIFTDGGNSFSGVLSDVSGTTCVVVSTGCSGGCSTQRINIIPIDKICCLCTSRA